MTASKMLNLSKATTQTFDAIARYFLVPMEREEKRRLHDLIVTYTYLNEDQLDIIIHPNELLDLDATVCTYVARAMTIARNLELGEDVCASGYQFYLDTQSNLAIVAPRKQAEVAFTNGGAFYATNLTNRQIDPIAFVRSKRRLDELKKVVELYQ